jgi:hypothetical protein
MKIKNLLSLILTLTSLNLVAQVVEVYTGKRPGAFAVEEKKLELFGRGLLDFGSEGQLQTTAQVIKINIGEPNKFNLPIYLLVGSINGDIGTSNLNKSTVMSLINPVGGTLNLSTNYLINLYKSNSEITQIRLSGLLSGKLITGRNYSTSEPISNTSAYFDSGLYFQTGAWEENEGYKDGGIFWAQAKYSVSYLTDENLQSYFGNNISSFPHGPRFEIGCFIQNRVNVKLSYYKAIGGDDIPTLDNSQFRIALDYNVFKN